MAGSIIPAANQTNAQAHGVTTNVIAQPVEAGLTRVEAFANNFSTEAGGIGYLFNHNITNVVATPVEKATDSIKTNLGGFIRATRTFVQDHPLITDGDHTAGTPATPVLPTVTDTLKQQVNKFRAWVGM